MPDASLHGVIPPVVTPLDSEGQVDVRSLEALVETLLRAGVHGVFALGSAGEAAYLTDAQRRVVVQTVAGSVAGRVPVLAGAVDTTASRVIEQGRAAVEGGADGIVVTAPFYARASVAETARHFEQVAAAVESPVYAYNIPANVHSSLPTEMVADLLERGVLRGVKDSSRDLGWLRTLLAATVGAPSSAVLVSAETLLDISLDLGASGIVSGLVNVDPAAFVRLYESQRRGDRAAVAAEQNRITVLTDLYHGPCPGGGPNAREVGGIKAALTALGKIENGAMSAPLPPISDELRHHARGVLTAAGVG